MSQPDTTPYNPKNRLITEAEIRTIFKDYGLQLKPRNLSLYRKAFIHKSYCVRKNEDILTGNRLCPEGCLPLQEEPYERLEYLGDSVIGLAVASYLYERYPDGEPGFLTYMRSRIVNGQQLADFARLLGFERFLVVSSQIEASGGRDSTNLLEDAFEAFVGAMYLDFNDMRIKNEKLNGFGIGLQAAQVWLINFLEQNVDFTDIINNSDNYKERLIRYLTSSTGTAPKFLERASGKDGVTVAVKNGDNVIATFKAADKKAAEQGAARLALENLGCTRVGGSSF